MKSLMGSVDKALDDIMGKMKKKKDQCDGM